MLFKSIYIFVFVAWLTSLSYGVFNAFLHLNKNKLSKSVWKAILLLIFIAIAILGIPIGTSFLIALLPGADYWFVLLYTIILALIGYSGFYRSPKEEPQSLLDAFKIGYTKQASKFFLARLSTNVFIQSAYISILILSQINDLGIIELSDISAYFVNLNKYGIVIIFAIQKLISEMEKSISKRKALMDAYDERIKYEEESLKEIKKDTTTFLENHISLGNTKEK